MRIPLSAVVLFAGVLLLAACGSESDADPLPTPTAPPPTPTAGDDGAVALERFHYVATLTLREQQGGDEAREVVVSTEGDFQAPDRHAFTYATRFGGTAIERAVVLIGEEAWLRQGEEPWRKAAADDPQLADLLASAFSAVRPHFLGGPEFERVRENVRRLPSTAESVNGVSAAHYRVGSPGREIFGVFMANEQLFEQVRDFRWDLWLAQDGAWPVRLVASATVLSDLAILDQLDLDPPTLWEMRIDISRPNDPTLRVVAPEEGG